MSTRSNIALLKLDGKLETSYCHNDGSFSGVGEMLYLHYNDIDKIKELVSLGQLSSLDEEIESSYFYTRDRSEDLYLEKYRTVNSYLNHMKKDSSYEYCYVFKEEDNQWYVSKENSNMLGKNIVDLPLLEEKMLLSNEVSANLKEMILRKKELIVTKENLEQELPTKEITVAQPKM